jgi:hypothetical protein
MKVCDSVRLAVLYSIPTEFEAPIKIIRLNKISLHSSVSIVTFPLDSCSCYRSFKISHFKNDDLQHWRNIPYSDLLWCKVLFSYFGNCWSSSSCSICHGFYLCSMSTLKALTVPLLDEVQMLFLLVET